MLETAVKTNIDVGKINDRYFINVVAAGLLSEAVGEVTIKEKDTLWFSCLLHEGNAGPEPPEIVSLQN